MERGIQAGRNIQHYFLPVALTALLLVAPSTARAQAAVPTITPPAFQSTDLDPFFNQADNTNAVAAWEQIVSGGLAAMRAQWEVTADSQINALVSTVTNSDDFNTQAEYQDYVKKSLEIQKADSLAAWMRASEATITTRRESFSDKVAAKKKSAAEDESERNQKLALAGFSAGLAKLDPGAGSEDFAAQAQDAAKTQLAAAQKQWEQDFNKKVQEGMNEYQKAMGALEKDYKSLLGELDTSDARFQQNINQLKAYEQTVRNALSASVTSLETFLQNPMLQPGGDMSASAAGLQAQIDQMKASLLANQPLSVVAGQMRDFLGAQKATAQGNADVWAAQVAKPASYSLLTDAGSAWASGSVGSVQQYYDSGQNPGGLLGFLSGQDARTLLGIQSADVCGVTADPNAVAGTHTCYSGTGGNAFTYGARFDAITCIALGLAFDPISAIICAAATFPKAETTLQVTVGYTYKDQNAADNQALWQGYSDQFNTKSQEWGNSLVPAIESWEQQRKAYEDEYAAWKIRADQIRTQAATAYQQGQEGLVGSRNRWLAQMKEEKKGGERTFDRLEDSLSKKLAKLADSPGNGNKIGLQKQLLKESESIFQQALLAMPRGTATDPNVKADLDAARKLLPTLETDFLQKAAGAPNSSALQTLVAEFQNSARGMMNAAVAGTLDEQARRMAETVRNQLTQMGESAGYTVSTSGGGLVLTREIPSGEARLRPGGDPASGSGYEATLETQTVVMDVPDAVAIRTGANLFSQWDMASVAGDFNAQASSLQAGLQGVSDRNVALLTGANDAARRNLDNYRAMVAAQVRDASTYRQLAVTLLTGGTLQSFANQMASQEIERLTGLPAGLISGLMGGMSFGDALRSATEDLVSQHIDQVTGIQGLGSLMVAGYNNQHQSNQVGLDVDVNFSASQGFSASVDAGFGFGHLSTDVAIGPDGFSGSVGAGFDLGFAQANTVAGLDVTQTGFNGYASADMNLDLGFANMGANAGLVFSDEGFNGYAAANASIDLGIVSADVAGGAVFSDEGFTAYGSAGVDIGNGLLAADASVAGTLSQDGFSVMGGVGISAGWGLADVEAAGFYSQTQDGYTAGGTASASVGWGLVDAHAAGAVAVSENGFSGMASAGADIGNGLLAIDGSGASALSSDGFTATGSVSATAGWGLAGFDAVGAVAASDQGLTAAGTASSNVGWGLYESNFTGAATVSEDGFSGMASYGMDFGNGLAAFDASGAAALSGDGFNAAATAGFSAGWGMVGMDATALTSISNQGVTAGATVSASVGWGLVDANVAGAASVTGNGFSGMASGGVDIGNGLLAADASAAAALSGDGFTAAGSAGISAGWGLAGIDATALTSLSNQGVTAGGTVSASAGWGLVDANFAGAAAVSGNGFSGMASGGVDVGNGLLAANAAGAAALSGDGFAAAGSAGISAGWGLADANLAAMGSASQNGVTGAASGSVGLGFGLAGFSGSGLASANQGGVSGAAVASWSGGFGLVKGDALGVFQSDYSGNFAAAGASSLEGAGGLISAREQMAFMGGSNGFGAIYSATGPTVGNIRLSDFARQGI